MRIEVFITAVHNFESLGLQICHALSARLCNAAQIAVHAIKTHLYLLQRLKHQVRMTIKVSSKFDAGNVEVRPGAIMLVLL